MLSDNKCNVYFMDINIGDIIEKTYEKLKDTSNVTRDVCNHEIFGDISYEVLDDEIKLCFSKKNLYFNILNHPVLFIVENKEEDSLSIFTKSDLKKAIEDFEDLYEFIVNSKIIKGADEILKNIPSRIILRQKKDNVNLYDVFVPLNKKHQIPNKDAISIETNELISQNINSLGILRDNIITVVIKKRDELIKEIRDFMDNKTEKIMKMLGVDGIGKSLTCVYLTSLVNDFRIVYFNLKEFHDVSEKEKINIFKSQLMNYYTFSNNNFDENEKEIIYKKNFNEYNEAMNKFDEECANKVQVNFWKMLNYIINSFKGNFNKKILCIIDQYKSENDQENELNRLENILLDNLCLSNIKLLVVSSLNDMRVKSDFIEILRQCSRKKLKENIQIFENTKDVIVPKNQYEEEDIFKDFLSDEDYSNTSDVDKNKNDFEKIKIFNDEYDEQENLMENKDERKNIEKEMLNKIENYILNYNNNKHINKINKRYRIIYINCLISTENMETEDNKQIIQKLADFDYNPKYYNKLRNYYYQHMRNKNLDELYNEFILQTYKNIKSKIFKFYCDLNKKFEINLKEKDIALIILELMNIVENNIELNLSSLIYYLNKFPIKYLKIIKVDDNTNHGFIRLNDDISDSKFRIEYAFPFIRLIFSRLLFDYSEDNIIQFSDLSSSGIGSLLEKQIRKAIIIDGIFSNFSSRYVWTLKEFLSIKKNKNQSKGKLENKYKPKIDFFNLKELTYDDIDGKKNPLDIHLNYYIIPSCENNPMFDSIILIPCTMCNEKNKLFDLIALQISVNKRKIYSLEQYHNATNESIKYIENIYGIKINKKYFIFVLAKEYNNKKTQDDLILLRIPFIFFSSSKNCFYFDENKKIDSVKQLLNDKYKIFDKGNQSIYYKNNIFLGMNIILNKKRKRDNTKITSNLFDFTLRKVFKDEKPLILTEKVTNEIIDTIKNSDYYKDKNIIIKYIFRAVFSRTKELLECDNNLIGIVFYKSKIFLIHNKLDSIVKMVDENPNEKEKRLCFYDLVFKKEPEINEESDIIIKEPKLENLLKYSLKKPSNVFVFSIYEKLD